MVHEEERHCAGSRPNGLVPNRMRVKPEGLKFPEYGAGVSDQFSDKGITNFDGLSIKNYGAERHLLVPTRDGCNDALYGRTPAKDWVKELVARTRVNFLPVLLVLEDDCDVLSMVQEFRVGVREYTTGSCPKDETSHSHSLGSTRRG